MKELLRTNDPVRISWLTAVLAEAGVEAIVLDTHTSILEGQIGAIPRRIMVVDEDYESALDLVSAAERDVAVSEPEDAVLDGRVVLRQPRNGYRVAIDPVLLAAAVPEADGLRVLDVGCGVGAAGLCVATRLPGARVFGLDFQAQLIELARGNAERNGLADRAAFHCGDLLHPPLEIGKSGFDQVIANPPYLPAERADPRTGEAKSRSHIEGEARLSDWIDFCLQMAAPKGSVTMIHRADRLDEILKSLHGRAGAIVVFPLWPRWETEAKRVIVRATVGSKAPMRISPGLVLHDADGAYTSAAEAVLLSGAAIEM